MAGVSFSDQRLWIISLRTSFVPQKMALPGQRAGGRGEEWGGGGGCLIGIPYLNEEHWMTIQVSITGWKVFFLALLFLQLSDFYGDIKWDFSRRIFLVRWVRGCEGVRRRRGEKGAGVKVDVRALRTGPAKGADMRWDTRNRRHGSPQHKYT